MCAVIDNKTVIIKEQWDAGVNGLDDSPPWTVTADVLG